MPLRSRIGRAGARALPLAGCACLALAWTWPLALHLGDSVVSASWWYDGLLNASQLETFSWNLVHRPAHLLDGTQFYPHPEVLGFTEQMPALALLARVFRLAGASPIGAYNLVLLIGLALDGWAAFLLVRTVTGRVPLAVLAAALTEAMPYLVYELGRVQLIWLGPWLAAVACLHRVATGERARGAAVGLAAAVAVGWGSCIYYSVLLAPLLIVCALVYAASGAVAKRPAFLLRSAAAMAAGTLPLLPGLLAYRTLSSTYGFGRSIWNVAPADLAAYARLSPGKWAFWGARLAPTSAAAERVLFPGGVLLVLLAVAAAALIATTARRVAAAARAAGERRAGPAWSPIVLTVLLVAAAVACVRLRDLTPALAGAVVACAWPRRAGAADGPGAAIRALAVVAVVGFALSLGVSVKIAGAEVTLPLRWVYDVMPGFHAVRLVGRWGAVAIAACASLVAIAAARAPARSRLLRVGAPLALALAALVELRPRPLGLAALTPLVDERPAYRFLRDHPGGAVVALPVRGAADRRVDGVAEDAIVTFAAACFHHHRTVNGMSGFDPPFYREVVLPAMAAFPHPESLRLLDALGVRWVVLRTELLTAPHLDAILAFAGAHPERFRLALRESKDVVLERVGGLLARWPPPPSGPEPSLAPFPPGCAVRAWAPAGAESVSGDLAGFRGWVSDAPQRSGETFTVECGEPVVAAGLWLGLGGRFAAYPRGVAIEARGADGAWRRVLAEDDAADLDRLVLHPLEDRVVKRFAGTRASAWRVTQTGTSVRDPWAVAAIGVVRAP